MSDQTENLRHDALFRACVEDVVLQFTEDFKEMARQCGQDVNGRKISKRARQMVFRLVDMLDQHGFRISREHGPSPLRASFQSYALLRDMEEARLRQAQYQAPALRRDDRCQCGSLPGEFHAPCCQDAAPVPFVVDVDIAAQQLVFSDQSRLAVNGRLRLVANSVGDFLVSGFCHSLRLKKEMPLRQVYRYVDAVHQADSGNADEFRKICREHENEDLRQRGWAVTSDRTPDIKADLLKAAAAINAATGGQVQARAKRDLAAGQPVLMGRDVIPLMKDEAKIGHVENVRASKDGKQLVGDVVIKREALGLHSDDVPVRATAESVVPRELAEKAPRALEAINRGSQCAVAIGEPVRLKSGGPTMYVEAVADGKARCRWTKPSGLIERGEFDVADLEGADT